MLDNQPREVYLLELEPILAAFRFGSIQTFAQILKKLKEFDREPEEVGEYLDLRTKALKDRLASRIFCGLCKNEMIVFDVNSTPSNQIGGPWRSMWQCTNMDCGNELLSKKNAMEERKHRIKARRREERKHGNR